MREARIAAAFTGWAVFSVLAMGMGFRVAIYGDRLSLLLFGMFCGAAFYFAVAMIRRIR